MGALNGSLSSGRWSHDYVSRDLTATICSHCFRRFCEADYLVRASANCIENPVTAGRSQLCSIHGL